MPGTESEVKLLIKLLGLTGSSVDNEALVALRKANALVVKICGSWEELLKGHFTIAADPFQSLSDPCDRSQQVPPAFKSPPPPRQAYQTAPKAPPAPQPAPAQSQQPYFKPSYYNKQRMYSPNPSPRPRKTKVTDADLGF